MEIPQYSFSYYSFCIYECLDKKVINYILKTVEVAHRRLPATCVLLLTKHSSKFYIALFK